MGNRNVNFMREIKPRRRPVPARPLWSISGIIPRFSEVGKQFPDSKEFHTLRVQPPAGNFYTTDARRQPRADAIERADFAVIGSWRDEIKINQAEVAKYIAAKGRRHVLDNVITRCHLAP